MMVSCICMPEGNFRLAAKLGPPLPVRSRQFGLFVESTDAPYWTDLDKLSGTMPILIAARYASL